MLVLWILNKEINLPTNWLDNADPDANSAGGIIYFCIPGFVPGSRDDHADILNRGLRRAGVSGGSATDEAKLEELDPSASNQSRYISDVSRFLVHENTTAEYFQVGDDMFPVLVRELKQAKKYIFIEYFIINDGVMQTILNILERKLRGGVDVP